MLTLLCFIILSIFINLLNIFKTIKAKYTNSFVLNLSIPTFTLVLYCVIVLAFSKIYKNTNIDYIRISLILHVIVCSFFTSLEAILISIKCIIYKEINYLLVLLTIILISIIAPAINIICIPMFYFSNLLFKKLVKKNNKINTYLYLNFK